MTYIRGNRRVLTAIFVTLSAFVVGRLGVATTENGANKTVAIAQIVEHPSLNAIRDGIVASLKRAFPGSQLTLRYYNAQGDMNIAAQIGQKIVGDRPDVIIGISTAMSQALVARKSDIPMVFSAVNDPIKARLITSLEKPGGRITGVLYNNPVERQAELLRSLMPKVQRVGVLYNPAEINSVNDLHRLRTAFSKPKITTIEGAVSTTSQLLNVAQSLSRRVDAIYVPTDNTVVSAIESVVKVCNTSSIPLFAADEDSVRKGALAALTLDQFELGEQTGKLAVRILAGASPGNIPVVVPQKFKLVINKKRADSLGMTIPAGLAGTATILR